MPTPMLRSFTRASCQFDLTSDSRLRADRIDAGDFRSEPSVRRGDQAARRNVRPAQTGRDRLAIHSAQVAPTTAPRPCSSPRFPSAIVYEDVIAYPAVLQDIAVGWTRTRRRPRAHRGRAGRALRGRAARLSNPIGAVVA